MMLGEDKVEVRFFDPALTWRLLTYVRPYLRFVLFSLCVFLVMSVSLNMLPVLVKRAIDTFLATGSEVMTDSDRRTGVLHLGGLYLALSAASYFIRFVQSLLMSWIGQRIISDIRVDVFAKVMRMPLQFFDHTPVGRLMTRVTSDVEAMQRMVTDGVVGLTADTFMLMATAGFMYYLSPRLALVLFSILPILFGLLTYVNYRLRTAHRNVRRLQAGLNSYVQEAITGMTTIQLFNREKASYRLFNRHNGHLQEGLDLSVRWMSYYYPLLDIIRGITIVLVLLVGGLTILGGGNAITIGTLVAFLAYIRTFFQPLEDLSDKSSMFQQAMASSERIFQLMDTDEEINDPLQPKLLRTFDGKICFDKVSFAYNDNHWIFQNLSFMIEPGESIALVGATGSGKTSVIRLISRLYDVQKGAVTVDGIDVRDLTQHDLRRCMGIVLQDPFIFSGSITDNISLRNPDISAQQIREAARYVNADRFISLLKDGYDTMLNERGPNLSTGQKQLLALCRAFVRNPDILFILDEATANVDTETEVLIQDALFRIMRNRTSIIIAHRLSTIRHVDRILVMRQGDIIESGSHVELLQRGGYYKRLYELMSYDVSVAESNA